MSSAPRSPRLWKPITSTGEAKNRTLVMTQREAIESIILVILFYYEHDPRTNKRRLVRSGEEAARHQAETRGRSN